MIVVGIREAHIMDVPRLTELSEQLGYRVTEEGTRTRLEYLIQEKNNVIYVAEVNNRVVGWVHVSIYKTLVIDETANVLGLIVDRAFYRRGIGKKLMRRAEEWAKNNGYSGIMLKSNVIRQDAHSFYRRLGYQNVKSQYVFRKYFDR